MTEARESILVILGGNHLRMFFIFTSEWSLITFPQRFESKFNKSAPLTSSITEDNRVLVFRSCKFQHN